MKLLFLFNTIDESHVTLFDNFYSKLKDNFSVAVFFQPKTIGTGKTPYIRKYGFLTNESDKELYKKIINSDCVIIGACPFKVKKYAIAKRKRLTFIEGERIYKIDYSFFEKIKKHIGLFIHYGIYQRKNLYWLGIGHYVESDFKKHHLFKNRVIPWGYWPELGVKEHDVITKEIGKKIRFVWIGQLIELKRPFLAIEIANKIAKDNHVDFELVFLGNGPLREKLHDYTLKQKNIQVLGRVPLEEVKNHLLKSHFALFTSDYHDGWAMGINQSLECGCVPIAQKTIGAAQLLIKNKNNGYLFNNINDLEVSIKDHQNLSLQARKSYLNSFCPKAQSEYLLNFINSKINNK